MGIYFPAQCAHDRVLRAAACAREPPHEVEPSGSIADAESHLQTAPCRRRQDHASGGSLRWSSLLPPSGTNSVKIRPPQLAALFSRCSGPLERVNISAFFRLRPGTPMLIKKDRLWRRRQAGRAVNSFGV